MRSVLELPRTSRLLADDSKIDVWARKTLATKLQSLRDVSIRICDRQGELRLGDGKGPEILITIHRFRAYSRILLGGTIGAGESYWDGDWDCSSLTELIRVFVRNRETMNGLDSGLAKLLSPIAKSLHRFRSNDLNQARKNIGAHYDLGNDFFELFLDETWMYSSAYFATPETSLTDAQNEKNDRLCRHLELKPTDHLVEIGTGWGGFAIHAAKHYGCRITTTTISERQFELATERVRDAGLSDQITIVRQDYRTLQGQYDKLVSIEMIEAVGIQYLDTYFETCSRLLKPGGKMGLQSILIRDQYFEQASKSVDFIQAHIFPGSAIPSLRRILESTTRKTSFLVERIDDFGEHYARTLELWSKKLTQNRDRITELGYPSSLYRLWQFYFAYCEGGFLEKSITVDQIIFSKSKTVSQSGATV